MNKHILAKLFTFSFLLIFHFSVFAQLPVLVKDINPSGDSEPFALTPFKNSVYFFANDGQHGYELWVSDGSSEGTRLVKDINPGPANALSLYGFHSYRKKLIEYRDRLYFFANDGVHGLELWSTNGTTEGTMLVKDFVAGSTGSQTENESANWMMVANDKLFFRVNLVLNNIELGVTDGTEQNTVLIDIQAGMDGSHPEDFYAYKNQLFFSASIQGSGRELWSSTGTEAGTRMVKDFYYSSNSGRPEYFREVNNILYFSARDGEGRPYKGTELWRTDGTEAGTWLVKDIHTGYNKPGGAKPSFPENLTAFNGKLIFSAKDSLHNDEVWISDGTETGTTILKDINPNNDPNARSTNPKGYTEFKNKLFFSAYDTLHSDELWVTDGTTEGTYLLKNINTSPGKESNAGSHPHSFTEYNGKLYFVAQKTATRGSHLWVTDGTADGTAELTPAEHSVNSPLLLTLEFVNTNGQLFFPAKYYTYGKELYKVQDNPSGIAEKLSEHEEIFVFPNPAEKSSVTIRSKENLISVRLKDASGIQLSDYSFKSHEYTIPVLHLSPGVYFVEIQTATKTVVKKVIRN